jgi:hypothetical protein
MSPELILNYCISWQTFCSLKIKKASYTLTDSDPYPTNSGSETLFHMMLLRSHLVLHFPMQTQTNSGSAKLQSTGSTSFATAFDTECF